MSVRLSVSWDAPCKTVLRIEVPLHVMTTGNQSSGVLDRGATPPLERGNYRVGKWVWFGLLKCMGNGHCVINIPSDATTGTDHSGMKFPGIVNSR